MMLVVALTALLVSAQQDTEDGPHDGASMKTLQKEAPDQLSQTLHFIIGEAPHVSLVKAEMVYHCMACGHMRTKRLRKSSCFECQAEATEPIKATLWPGCDPRETGGTCPGPVEHLTAPFPAFIQVSTLLPKDWTEGDKTAFKKAIHKAVYPAIEQRGKLLEKEAERIAEEAALKVKAEGGEGL